MTQQNPTNNTLNNKDLFLHLVSLLAMSALQQLGKLPAASDGKPAVNLEAAQATIDTLDMLEAKTRGNLDAEESKVLQDTLTMLKLNYVEAAKAVASARTAGAQQTAREGTGGDKADQQAQAAQPSGDAADKAPKFHKTYG